MPPQYHSDSDSDGDVIQPKKKLVEEEQSDAEEVAEEEGEEDANESEASDEYTVEMIMDHKFAGEDGNVSY
jgi:uncharacterized protein YciI